MRFLSSVIPAIAVLLAASLAFADDPPSTTANVGGAGTTSIPLSQVNTNGPQKVELTYWAEFSGPSVGALGYSNQINPSTGLVDPSWPQVLENQIKMNYMLTDNVFVGPVLNLYVTPGQSGITTVQDSGVRIGTKSLYKNGAFKISSDLRLLAPLSGTDITAGAGILFESLDNMVYEVPHSKWTVGLLSFNKYHTYNNDGITNGNANLDFDLYEAPYAEWQFSRKVAGTLFVEFYPAHQINAAGWTVSQPADINPGINWDITDRFSVNPGFIIWPTDLSLNAVGTVIYLNGKIL